MPGSSSNTSSFIPKRGPARRRKPKTRNQIFLFSIITYSLLFAALIAAGATFVYKNYLTSQLQDEVAALNTVITTFSTEDLARVHEFDITLKRATQRVENNASVTAVLDGLDEATVEPVQLESLTIERQGDTEFSLSGVVKTSSFDAAMFQRKIYNARRQLFTSVDVNEVVVRNETTTSVEEEEASSGGAQEVGFNVVLSVPLEEVLYDPAEARLTGQVPAEAEAVFPATVETEDITGSEETSI